MKLSYIISAILTTLAFTACVEPSGPELETWTDPVTGEESLFQTQSIGPWALYALDAAPEGLALVARSGQLILGYDEMRHFGAISIPNSQAQSAAQIYAYDTNGDGVFNMVELVSPEQSLEINLIEGEWIISSAAKLQESAEQ